MSTHRRLAAPLISLSILAVLVAACTSGSATSVTSSGPSGGPATSPEPAVSPADDAIEHPTGARDVVLRYEEGGGFIMPGFLAAQTPHFTLYGDGRIVFRNPMLEPPPAEGSVSKMNPLRTAQLSEEQIQELLRFALADGGLAVARPKYENNLVADASTAFFTIDAGGLQKKVSVYALGLDVEGGADAPARAAFGRLAERLSNFDNGGTIETDVYVPSAYRGILLESGGVVAPDQVAWPWPDVTAADFAVDADPNGLQFPHRLMTTEEIDALGVTGYEGGFQNLVLVAPDRSTTYTLSLRPLLPDEDA
jgi:hypothetical protein